LSGLIEPQLRYEKVDQDIFAKIDEWNGLLDAAQNNLDNMTSAVNTHLQEQEKKKLNEARLKIKQLREHFAEAKRNLNSISALLVIKKTNLELKEIAIRSWPKKAWIERLIWVSAAVIAAGSASFAFTGGLPAYQGIIAMSLWLSGFVLMIISLAFQKKWDDEKWAFFEEEFRIDRIKLRASMLKKRKHQSISIEHLP